jgi:hypothetical protein
VQKRQALDRHRPSLLGCMAPEASRLLRERPGSPGPRRVPDNPKSHQWTPGGDFEDNVWATADGIGITAKALASVVFKSPCPVLHR